MKFTNTCQFLLCIAFSLCAQVAGAQGSPDKPKEFFSKHYAAGSGALDNGRTATDFKQNSSQTVTNQDLRGSAQSKQIKRLIVSLLVNSLNKEHLARVLEVALKLHDQKLAYITSIQHVGDYRNFTSELQTACEKRGITTIELQELPFGLEREVSPVWSLLGQDGRHLVEGIVALDRLINEWGEYDPKLAEQSKDGGALEGL